MNMKCALNSREVIRGKNFIRLIPVNLAKVFTSTLHEKFARCRSYL